MIIVRFSIRNRMALCVFLCSCHSRQRKYLSCTPGCALYRRFHGGCRRSEVVRSHVYTSEWELTQLDQQRREKKLDQSRPIDSLFSRSPYPARFHSQLACIFFTRLTEKYWHFRIIHILNRVAVWGHPQPHHIDPTKQKGVSTMHRSEYSWHERRFAWSESCVGTCNPESGFNLDLVVRTGSSQGLCTKTINYRNVTVTFRVVPVTTWCGACDNRGQRTPLKLNL